MNENESISGEISSGMKVKGDDKPDGGLWEFQWPAMGSFSSQIS